MTQIITLAVAKQRLAATVEQYGAEHKPADRCQYFKKDVNGEQVPLCIIGAAFTDELSEAGISTDRGNGESVYKLAEIGTIPATERAALFLSSAQDRQDAGLTWGSAVEFAAEYVEVRHNSADDSVAIEQS